MIRIKGLKKTAFILAISAAVLLYNIGTYNLIAEKGVDILSPTYNQVQPVETGLSPNVEQELDPPLGNQTVLPGVNTIFTMMVFNFPIELAIVFIAEIVFSSLIKADRKKMNFLRLLILLGSAACITVGSSITHYFLVWPAIHDWPIHAEHTYNDTSTYEIKPLYGEQEDPINKNYTLAAESWTFIQEENFTANQITKYIWVSDISVQGREVTEEQFNTLQAQSLSERTAFFETLGYNDGNQDKNKTTIDLEGSIYFVFYNPNTLQANLELTYTYQYTFFSPAVTVLMFIIAAIIILGLHFLAFKFIQKLSLLNSGVALLLPAIYYPIIWSTLAKQTRELDFVEKTGNQFMFALIVSGIFLIGIILILIWNLTLMGTQQIVSTKQAEWQQRYDEI